MTIARPFSILIVILLVKASLLCWLIVSGPIGLGPDEAQYWTWSRLLDWGYYSKPPGIAWQIKAGTLLFGETVLGVRFFSLVLGAALPLTLYRLALHSKFTKETAFWSALLFALSPFGIAASLFAITDTAMVLAWILAVTLLMEALASKKTPHYLLLGIFIGSGALFKWQIYALWGFLLLLLPFFSFLRRKKIIGGILISLIGLLPSVIWNVSHEWATFRHVFFQIQGSDLSPQQGGNPLDFLGGQIALLSPVIFFLLLYAAWYLFSSKKKIPSPLKLSALLTFSILGAFFVLSFFKKVQGNWPDLAYPTAMVLIAWSFCEGRKNGIYWLFTGILTSLLLALTAISIALFPSFFPYKINPFKHNVGGEALFTVLKDKGYDPDNDFLFSSKYQTTSLLSFYSEKQQRAYFLNLYGIRHNQFSFWPGMQEEQKGKDGFYVVIENEPHLTKHLNEIPSYLNHLAPFFDTVEFKGMAPLFDANGTVVKGALIFKGSLYNGKSLDDPSRW